MAVHLKSLSPGIRVFLVDDSLATRRWYRALISLQPDIEVYGEAEDALTASDWCASPSAGFVADATSVPYTDRG